VSDDGVVGTVSIGSKDGAQVEEAKRRVELILDPPTAELGVDYEGKVVNITKFGAFVNILPGRDGLLHISKLGGGRRIDRVEDVLSLGDVLTVRVDDIDNAGKLSLSLAGDDAPEPSGDGEGGNGERPRSGGGERPRDRERGDRDRGDRGERDRGDRDRGERKEPARTGGGDRESAGGASFEDFWEGQAKSEFGDLGPAEGTRPQRSGGGGGGGRGGGGGGRRRGGRGGGDRR